MKERELLSGSRGGRRLDDIAVPLAETYRAAFAGAPWYEVSKCTDPECKRGFCSGAAGDACPECGSVLSEAYDVDGLVNAWRRMLTDEDAVMEVGYKDGEPVRVTLARPTTPQELYERKYADVPPMEAWLDETMERELVWIEDTFANRNKQPRGNLKERGRTLASVALRYGGLAIATRTLAPQIVTATLRDVAKVTDVFVGNEPIPGVSLAGARSLSVVPDRRTLLRVVQEAES